MSKALHLLRQLGWRLGLCGYWAQTGRERFYAKWKLNPVNVGWQRPVLRWRWP